MIDESPQCKCKEDGYLRWAVGRKTFVGMHGTPLLHSMYWKTNEKSEAEELENMGIYKLVKGQVYDIVLQNYPACNGACEVHPWHLHGHHFWHVGTFEGTYDSAVGYSEEQAGGNYKGDTNLMVGGDHQNTTPPFGEACSPNIEPCG
jgi:hypothetical protein